jgi:hypothetical protein
MTITNGYCTLAEFKSFHSITTADGVDDAVIESLIEGVSRAIDRMVSRTFYARTETRTYDVPEGNCLELDDDLLTLTTLTNGDGTVITSSYYKLYPLNITPKRRVELTNTYGWAISPTHGTNGAISIVGSWGYSATTPDDVNLICLSEVMNEYKKRYGENASAITTVTSAGIVITPQGFLKSSLQRLASYRRLT